jgi:hypothetical protein
MRRLPLHGADMPSGSPAFLQLLLLPPADTQGLVLWSTPLFANVPLPVASELQGLYACMLSTQAAQAAPYLTSARLKHAGAFNNLYLPFVAELGLACFPELLQSPPPSSPAPQAASCTIRCQMELAAHVACFLRCNRMHHTLDWLPASATQLLPLAAEPPQDEKDTGQPVSTAGGPSNNPCTTEWVRVSFFSFYHESYS